MSGVTLRISVTDRDARAALARLAAFGRDPSPALKVVGQDLITSTQERIRDQVSPEGTRWPDLRPDYAAAKRGAGMLVESGRLIGSLTRKVEGPQLLVGTNVLYAAIHQVGGVIRPKSKRALRFRIGQRWVLVRQVKIPARPFLGISARDLEDMRETIEGFILRASRAGR